VNASAPVSEINYDRIRTAGDHIMPEPFGADRDTGQYPDGTTWIGFGHVSPGQRLEDAAGQRFLVMAHGPMQGTVVLRDRYRRMFYADSDQRMRAI
jgi:hypothetical protein